MSVKAGAIALLAALVGLGALSGAVSQTGIAEATSAGEKSSAVVFGQDAVAFLKSIGTQTANPISALGSTSRVSADKIIKALAKDKDLGIVKKTGVPMYACTRGMRDLDFSDNSRAISARRLMQEEGVSGHKHHIHAHGRKLRQLPQAPVRDPDASTLPSTSTGVPLLHSRNTSTIKIFLDFDGNTYQGAYWNDGKPVVTPAYDTDGNRASFSAAEKRDMIAIWRAVAEDYAAFDVDVTTEDPGVQGLGQQSESDKTYGIRVAIGGSADDWFLPWVGPESAGVVGVALFGSFGYVDSNTGPLPVFSFVNGYYGPNTTASAMNIWETVSHEVGHTFGLEHDGVVDGVEYYAGHGNWAPIMGYTDFMEISQWSKGEYLNANNPENDFEVIAQYIPYARDDHSNTAVNATALTSGARVPGLIGFNDPADFFTFVALNGTLNVRVDITSPWADLLKPRGYGRANLDVILTLYGPDAYSPTGMKVLARSNGQSWFPNAAQRALLTYELAGSGTYLLSVAPTGWGDPSTTGYTSYGSVGFYAITATFSAPPKPSPSPARSPARSPSPSPARSPSPSPARSPSPSPARSPARSPSPSPARSPSPSPARSPARSPSPSPAPTGR